MSDQCNEFQMQPLSEEAREDINKQELEGITGGVNTTIPLGNLRRSFSMSDLDRLQAAHATPYGSPLGDSVSAPVSRMPSSALSLPSSSETTPTRIVPIEQRGRFTITSENRIE